MDELICDMAEYYRIYDCNVCSVFLLSTLCWGLPRESRVKMKLAEQKYTTSEILLAGIFDRLSLLWWAKTEDGANNTNRPNMMMDVMIARDTESKNKAFQSGDDFMAEWNKLHNQERMKNG